VAVIDLSNFSKLRLLLRVLGSDPQEFYDRIEGNLQIRRERLWPKPFPYDAVTPSEALTRLEKVLGMNISGFLQDPSLCDIERKVRDGEQVLKLEGPIKLRHNADLLLARVCYLVCRTLTPTVVLETGVAYGVTSAFLLQAAAQNGNGRVYSIDLPPLGPGAERYVGFLIPPELRPLWSLKRGTGRRILPRLLPSLKNVDLFVQDSLHTYGCIMAELKEVWPVLRPGGVVIADDIHKNRAFRDFALRTNPACSLTVRRENKESTMFGLLVKRR